MKLIDVDIRLRVRKDVEKGTTKEEKKRENEKEKCTHIEAPAVTMSHCPCKWIHFHLLK